MRWLVMPVVGGWVWFLGAWDDVACTGSGNAWWRYLLHGSWAVHEPPLRDWEAGLWSVPPATADVLGGLLLRLVPDVRFQYQYDYDDPESESNHPCEECPQEIYDGGQGLDEAVYQASGGG